MVTLSVLATLADSVPDRRLQVLLVRRDGGVVLGLRQQQFAAGIGWYDQRTLEMAPRQLRQLQKILSRRGSAQVLAEAEAELPATLPFPKPGRVRPVRRGLWAPRRPDQGEPYRIFRGPASCPHAGRVVRGQSDAAEVTFPA
ncbi:MAG: hypothetical protein JO329_25405 [Planctomycetaceae bacterium]|nr:hypothetical protein [Planctomycetaceae bacterium]